MITQDYNLNTTNQLIDINDVHTSFTTLMSVTCENLQDTFEYAIINQKTLDTNRINFKKVVGAWEDSFTMNQENFQNWYLVLKSDKDTKCTVTLNITPLDYNTDPPQQPDTTALSQVRPQPKNSIRPQQPGPMTQQARGGVQPRRPVVQRPIQRPIRRPQPPVEEYDDYDDDDELYDDECGVDSAAPTGFARYYKCIAYSLIVIIVLLFILWWTGYIYKVPLLNRFFKKPAGVEQAFGKVYSSNSPTISYHPPAPVVVQVPPPQPPVFETPSVDTNFINEMRELKIDL